MVLFYTKGTKVSKWKTSKTSENHIQDENHLMVACPISSPGDDRNESMEDL